MNPTYTLTTDPDAVDWVRLAGVVRRAPLSDRRPADLERAFRNSHAAVFAWHGDLLIGCARAVSDGVFYATIFDVCVDPDYQGTGAGRAIVEALVARLPFEKVFLTAVLGKEGFYAKLDFLKHNNAMALYRPPLREHGLASGLLSPHTESSIGPARLAS